MKMPDKSFSSDHIRNRKIWMTKINDLGLRKANVGTSKRVLIVCSICSAVAFIESSAHARFDGLIRAIFRYSRRIFPVLFASSKLMQKLKLTATNRFNLYVNIFKRNVISVTYSWLTARGF